jgi:hypothetical protein
MSRKHLKEENTIRTNTLSFHEGAALPKNAPSWAVSASQRIQEKLIRSSSPSREASSSQAVPPAGVSRVLLHSCCAPCSGAMVEEMLASNNIDEVVVFFYNPNIHPKKEYEIRKQENKDYCMRIGVKFVDCDYDVENWYARMKGG